MRKSELVAAVATKLERTQVDVEEILNGIFEVIPDVVMSGEEVLTPIGKFKLKVTPPRQVLNPQTGEKFMSGETRRLVFKSSRTYKVKEEPKAEAKGKKTAKKR